MVYIGGSRWLSLYQDLRPTGTLPDCRGFIVTSLVYSGYIMIMYV